MCLVGTRWSDAHTVTGNGESMPPFDQIRHRDVRGIRNCVNPSGAQWKQQQQQHSAFNGTFGATHHHHHHHHHHPHPLLSLSLSAALWDARSHHHYIIYSHTAERRPRPGFPPYSTGIPIVLGAAAAALTAHLGGRLFIYKHFWRKKNQPHRRQRRRARMVMAPR